MKTYTITQPWLHQAEQLLQRTQESAPTFATSGFASVSVAALTKVWTPCLFCTFLEPQLMFRLET